MTKILVNITDDKGYLLEQVAVHSAREQQTPITATAVVDCLSKHFIVADDDNTCPRCGAVEGTHEWGTVGDGFDGYCPSCADKREESEEVKTG